MTHIEKVVRQRMGEYEKQYRFDRGNGSSQLPESASNEMLMDYGRYDAYRHICELYDWELNP